MLAMSLCIAIATMEFHVVTKTARLAIDM